MLIGAVPFAFVTIVQPGGVSLRVGSACFMGRRWCPMDIAVEIIKLATAMFALVKVILELKATPKPMTRGLRKKESSRR